MRPLRVLFVLPYVPSRLRPRPLHFIQGLVERGHQVVLCAVATLPDERDAVEALRAFCERIHVVSPPTVQSLWSSARALVRGRPMQAAYCSSAAMSAHIQAVLSAAPSCDVVHIEHLRAAAYGLAVRQRPRIFDAVDCMSALHAAAARLAPTWPSRLTARAELAPTRRFERTLLRRYDRVLVTSEHERRALVAVAGGAADAAPIETLPNGVDLVHFAPRAAVREAQTMIFVGRMAYHANLAAARLLLESIGRRRAWCWWAPTRRGACAPGRSVPERASA
jgi:glycosyltransferase involved in cell wall biosynthesis